MTVRFGVIGCGVIAYWSHLRILKNLSGARLVAAADPDAGARERANRLTGVPVEAEPAALLARHDIDAVVICSPTGLHAELGIEAARTGKHIYLEKPVAIDADGARRLSEAVRDAGVRFAPGFNRRQHPLFVQARELIASGAIGQVRTVFSSFCEPVTREAMPLWKRDRATGGGVLLDLGSHHADLLRWFLRDEVARVEARLRSNATEDDEAWWDLRLRGGAAAYGYFSFTAGRADFFEFIGELGTLRVDRHRAELTPRLSRRRGYGVRGAFVMPSRDAWAWRMIRLVRPSYDPSYRSALAAFVASIGGAAQGVSFADGWRSLEVVLAAEASAHASCPVDLPYANPAHS